MIGPELGTFTVLAEFRGGAGGERPARDSLSPINPVSSSISTSSVYSRDEIEAWRIAKPMLPRRRRRSNTFGAISAARTTTTSITCSKTVGTIIRRVMRTHSCDAECAVLST